MLIDSSSDNIISSISILIFTYILLKTTVNSRNITIYPLQSFFIISFNISTLSGALIIQSLNVTPVIYSLKEPIITFIECGLFQIILNIILYYYTNSRAMRIIDIKIKNNIINKMNLNNSISFEQYWALGFIGFISFVYTLFNTAQFGDVSGKFLDFTKSFIFFPFIIPLNNILFPVSKIFSGYKTKYIVIYGLFVALIGIATNSRGIISQGFTTIGEIFFILILMGRVFMTRKIKINIIYTFIFTIFLIPIATDLSYALLVVRETRDILSPTEILSQTVTQFNDKDSLNKYKILESALNKSLEYNELYIENPFINRLILTKYFDNTISLNKVRSGLFREELWGETIDRIILILPQPFVYALGIRVNKADMEYSFGDIMGYFEDGGGLGGYKTGSTVGYGLAVLGHFYFLIAFPIVLLAFITLQSLTKNDDSITTISPVMLLQIPAIYFLSGIDSFVNILSFSVRLVPQACIIYFLTLYIIRIFIPGSYKK